MSSPSAPKKPLGKHKAQSGKKQSFDFYHTRKKREEVDRAMGKAKKGKGKKGGNAGGSTEGNQGKAGGMTAKVRMSSAPDGTARLTIDASTVPAKTYVANQAEYELTAIELDLQGLGVGTSTKTIKIPLPSSANTPAVPPPADKPDPVVILFKSERMKRLMIGRARAGLIQGMSSDMAVTVANSVISYFYRTSVRTKHGCSGGP